MQIFLGSLSPWLVSLLAFIIFISLLPYFARSVLQTTENRIIINGFNEEKIREGTKKLEKRLAIREVRGREILDCRGDPTLEVDVITEDGVLGRADAPAGRSRGKHEAFELRDEDKRYRGLGVRKAVSVVNEKISPLLKGVDVTSQRDIDRLMIELDGTPNKNKLGGNSTVATSIAVARAAANSLSLPLYRQVGGSNASILPVPMFLFICGGKLAATDLVFQEFNAMPIGASSFAEAMRIGSEVYHLLGEMLSKKYGKYSLNT
jgi:enolase